MTQYIYDETNTSRVKISNDPVYKPTTLLSGELAYNYSDNSLFIASIDPENLDPIIIFTGFNNDFNISNYITRTISYDILDKAPTSASVALELGHKADLRHSNIFTGMNEFPYLEVAIAAPSQINLAVTIRMLKEYVDTTISLIELPPVPDTFTIDLRVNTNIENLQPSELGYDYLTNSLFVGNLIEGLQPIQVTPFDNSDAFLINSVSDIIYDKAPTSASVARELVKKADLTHSNFFTGMNEFPYLDIFIAAPSQENLPVTIRMLREYIDSTIALIELPPIPDVFRIDLRVNTNLDTLQPNELGYDYLTNSLYVGNLTIGSNPIKVSPIDVTETFLINDIDETTYDRAPTAAAVALALTKKADLTHSNVFRGMNEFPYLDVSIAAPSQENIPVTIRMLKEYTQQILNDVGLVKTLKLSVFEFLTIAEDDILIQHDNETENFSIVSITELGTNDLYFAPYVILDENAFVIRLSSPILCTVKVVFYV